MYIGSKSMFLCQYQKLVCFFKDLKFFPYKSRTYIHLLFPAPVVFCRYLYKVTRNMYVYATYYYILLMYYVKQNLTTYILHKLYML